jgi:uncharacterized membrane protein YeiH
VLEDVLVYVGTITFAIAGALTGVEKRFDVVGVMTLAVVTAIGGGSIRDVVAGIVPPVSLTNEPLLWTVFATGLLVFLLHHLVPRGRTLYVFDTVSLAIFAALGAQSGLAVGFGFWGTVFAGAISGVGGGIIRDVLSGQIPRVLYRSGDFYASAAATGAAATYLLYGLSPAVAVIVGALVAVTVRVGSRLAGLQLPTPRDPSW